MWSALQLADGLKIRSVFNLSGALPVILSVVRLITGRTCSGTALHGDRHDTIPRYDKPPPNKPV
jgi:hypothetical protein